MNSCPFGYYGDPVQECTCSHAMVSRYQVGKRHPAHVGAAAGPHRHAQRIEVPRVEYEKLSDDRLGEPLAAIRKRVEPGRARQAARFAGTRMLANADTPALRAGTSVGPGEARDFCRLDDARKSLLNAAMQ
jgi:magnesium chelatase family protein